MRSLDAGKEVSPAMEFQPGEIYVRREGWERIGAMEDVSDAEAVARFFQRRDGGEYLYAYVDRAGRLIEV